MATTSKGTPYVQPGDNVADYPTTSRALAEHIDAALDPATGPHLRALLAEGVMIANDADVPMTGGYTPQTGDDGNALLAYSAGILTATRDLYVDAFAYVGWAGNGVGYRRLDLTIAGNPYRSTSLATGILTTFGQVVSVCGVHMKKDDTVQVSVQQNTGGSLKINRHELRVVVRPR